MKAPHLPHNEAARLVRLRALGLLDTPAEGMLDVFTRLAARVTGMPISLISLIDADRQWFKSAVGLPQGLQTPRDVSFCGHAILQSGVFEVADARLDESFRGNPLVEGEPHVIHYAGAPLVTPDGSAVGTLCVISPQPGTLSDEQRGILAELANGVVEVLLLREKERELDGERRLAEAAQMSELAHVGMFSVDASGAVLHGDPQWVQALGAQSMADLAGFAWLDAIHVDDRPRLRARWDSAVREGVSLEGIFRCAARDALGHRWIKLHARPVDDLPAPVTVVGASLDVTDMVRLQEQLNRKHRLLEDVIEHLPCGLAVFDSELRHVLSNTPTRQLLGLPDHLFHEGTTFQSLFEYFDEHVSGQPGAEAVAQRVASINAREPQRIELVLRDGTVLEVRGTFMPDGSLIATYSSVTAARRAERDLLTSQARLARALEAASLGLWEYDLVADDVYLSQGWTQLLGLPGKDWKVRPKATLSFFPQQELLRMAAARRQLLKGEIQRLSLEHQMIDAAGQLIWVLTEAQVIERDADGRACKVVGTSKDITEGMKANAVLRAALQAADQASQAKSDFLATMSHEIRTPLNGVIGLTQLLRDAELPTMESDSVAMIDSCAKSLLSLVDNILDFSKIEAGRLTLEDVPTDLAQLVNEVSDLFSVRAADKGVRFDLRQDPGLPRWITADPGRLRQVLLNLLGNALKFTAQGGFSLQVFLADRDGARLLCFAVADTGIGIPAADQARLFTRFTQVDTSASRNHQGTGLGLAISRQLAQLMDGEVTLVSRLNEGSCFTLEIPLRVATAPRVVEASRTTAPRTDARILVAEDNEVNQLVALRMLASLGFASVTAVSTGQEAVDACSRESFDLVLMDCQMPGMDGLQATRQLRRMGVEVPVVAFTASATLEDRDRCLAAGMNDYLTKPVEKAVLADKLHRWLGEGGGGGEQPASTVTGAEGAFDPQAIERYFIGEAGLFVQARALFIRQTREAFTEFGALPRIEPEDLQRLAHRLRGSAATLGATSLARVCLLVETQPDLEADQCRAKLREVALAFEAFVHGSEAASLACNR